MTESAKRSVVKRGKSKQKITDPQPEVQPFANEVPQAEPGCGDAVSADDAAIEEPSEGNTVEADDDSDFSKEFLKQRFEELRVQAHHLYALLMGLPKENCFLRRDYNGRLRRETWNEKERISLKEFFEQYGKFHPLDNFLLYLEVDLKRIDADLVEVYTPHEVIYERSSLTAEYLESRLDWFFMCFCEQCMRRNRPFELTPETIARYGFTSEDVKKLAKPVKRWNKATQKMLQAEYDALCELDCIEK